MPEIKKMAYELTEEATPYEAFMLGFEVSNKLLNDCIKDFRGRGLNSGAGAK